MNKETSNIKSSRYNLVKIGLVKNSRTYNTFINWVIGEFDLYLKIDDSKALKVYFPNGWFSIGSFKNKEEQVNIEINVNGKSRISCDEIMKQLQDIYNHVIRFYEVKSESKCLID